MALSNDRFCIELASKYYLPQNARNFKLSNWDRTNTQRLAETVRKVQEGVKDTVAIKQIVRATHRNRDTKKIGELVHNEQYKPIGKPEKQRKTGTTPSIASRTTSKHRNVPATRYTGTGTVTRKTQLSPSRTYLLIS